MTLDGWRLCFNPNGRVNWAIRLVEDDLRRRRQGGPQLELQCQPEEADAVRYAQRAWELLEGSSFDLYPAYQAAFEAVSSATLRNHYRFLEEIDEAALPSHITLVRSTHEFAMCEVWWS